MKKEFKAENMAFLDSIDYIDDKILAEVLADVKVPKDGADNGKPRRAWKQIAVFAACMVLLGALFPVVTWIIGKMSIAPGGNPVTDPPLPTSTSRVIRNGYQVYGDEAFIHYYSSLKHYVPGTGIYEQLNKKDENDSASYRGIEALSQIINGKLYYIYDSLAKLDSDLKAAYLDISTMTSTEIGDISCSNISGYAYVYENYYYYSTMKDFRTREGALYRLSLDDGKEELILEFDTEESLFMVADGVIVTMNRFAGYIGPSTPKDCIIKTYDIETLEESVLWSNSDGKYRNVDSPAYLDGNLYFLASRQEYSTGEDLIRVNLANGQAEYVLEGISYCYWLTDDGIWYYPLEWRTVNYHSPFSSILNSLHSTNASPTLHYRDLEGKIDREVYTNSDIALESMGGAVIVNGKLCAQFCGSFPSLGLESASILAEIDLETGKITALDDPAFASLNND